MRLSSMKNDCTAWELMDAGVRLCGSGSLHSIFTALASILVPWTPSLIPGASSPLLSTSPLELPRLLLKQPRQPPASKASALAAPLPEAPLPRSPHSSLPLCSHPELHCHLLKSPSCPPGKSRAPCFVFLPGAFYCPDKLWI